LYFEGVSEEIWGMQKVTAKHEIIFFRPIFNYFKPKPEERPIPIHLFIKLTENKN
jgi:hypothetical protein